MSEPSDLYDDAPDGIVLRVHVQPGAGRSAVVGRHGDALKVRVAAPPVEGRANEALCKLLAKTAGVAPGRASVVKGTTARDKLVRFEGLDAHTLAERLP